MKHLTEEVSFYWTKHLPDEVSFYWTKHLQDEVSSEQSISQMKFINLRLSGEST